MFLLALKPCMSPCLGVEKCHGMYCLHASICTQSLTGEKMALLNPSHTGSRFFPNQVGNAKQANHAAKTKINLQKREAFFFPRHSSSHWGMMLLRI